MNILVIGGTRFLGRAIVHAALERGHDVTLFNRGQTNSDLFPDASRVIGDRRVEADLVGLQGTEWDAVIDPSAYFPRDVELLLDRSGVRADHYTFISSISVYQPSGRVGPDEAAPLLELTEEMSLEEVTGENYGALKVAAESVAEELQPGGTLILRPGLIVGPHDMSDRFTYWLWRSERGGEIIAPGDPEETVQFIDVRDLAAWTLDLVEKRVAGTFNATGPEQPLTFRELLDTTLEMLAPEGTTVRWVPDDKLLGAGVAPYTEMPLWIPAPENGLSRTDVSRALESGLTFRPLQRTIAETMEWFRKTDRYASREIRAGGGEEKYRKKSLPDL